VLCRQSRQYRNCPIFRARTFAQHNPVILSDATAFLCAVPLGAKSESAASRRAWPERSAQSGSPANLFAGAKQRGVEWHLHFFPNQPCHPERCIRIPLRPVVERKE
jgi:hypothetical protein